MDGFWRLAEGFFIACIVGLVLVTITIICVYRSGDRLDAGDQQAQTFLFIKIVLVAADVFATLFFWYLFGMCAYWFIFQKLQSSVHTMMPVDSTLYQKQYDSMLTAVLIAKLLSIFYKIYFEQSAIDIFFIDWESPRQYKHNGKKINSVSPWRRMFIANELNELQGEKHISTNFVLITFLLLAEGFNWKNLCYLQANLETAPNDAAIESYVLNFFVITFIMFAVGILNYVAVMATVKQNPPAYLDFVDLCSVANMSVIMFNEDLQGYYIHGKSASGSADVDARQLRLNLQQEAIGNASIRGITPAYRDHQTFQMCMPK